MFCVTLPAASRVLLPELLRRLTEQLRLGSLGGLMEGDYVGRVGDRLFGTDPMTSGIKHPAEEALDAAVPPLSSFFGWGGT